METINFLVQGSAPEPYRVTIKKKGHNLNTALHLSGKYQ